MPRLLVWLRLLIIACAFSGVSTAGAQTFEETVALFASDSFPDTGKGIAALAAQPDPRGVNVLEALADRRLLTDKASGQVFYKDKAGAGFDARSGSAATIPEGVTTVRLNNRLRNEVQAALGQMTLLSPDPEKRKQAAEAVLRSRDPTSRPLIEAALAKEADPAIAAIFRQARSVIILLDATAPEADRIAAVADTVARGDDDALSLLRQVETSSTGSLQSTVRLGISSMESAQRWREFGQTVWFGISLGSVLLLAAIGLAITFGVMGVINMAHGEMVMIGAYVTFMVQELIRANAPGLIDWSLPIALPLAFVVAGAVGILIERCIISFLYGRPLETLLATLGVSLILQQAVRTVFGPTNREVSAPSYMSGSFDVLGLQITSGRLWIVVECTPSDRTGGGLI